MKHLISILLCFLFVANARAQHTTVIIDAATGELKRPTAALFLSGNPTIASGGGTWGSITGTLSNQTDLNNALGFKSPLASPTFTGVLSMPTPFTLGAVSVLPTGTELNFVDGVTSAIQTQLDNKQPLDAELTEVATGTLSALTVTTLTLTNDLNVAQGGTGVSSLTAYAPIFGGTTSTAAVQSGTVGTAGQVLTSNGAGALPTFQAAGGSGDSVGSIKLWSIADIANIPTDWLQSDGTNGTLDLADVESVARYIVKGNGTVATPTVDVPAGTYGGTQNITISDATSGATIRYTTNGADPTTGSTAYSTPVAISTSSTLKAKAWKDLYAASAVFSAAYTINSGPAIVQNVKNTGTGTTVTASISPTSGNRLVVLVMTDAASFTVTDNQSTSYTATPTSSGFGSLTGQAVSAAVGSGVTTVTITPNASAYIQVFVYEVSGLTTGYTTGEYDDSFHVSSATWTSGSFSTATANSIVFFIAGAAGTGSDSTTFGTYTNGFASYGSNAWYGTGSSGLATVTSYKIVSSTGTQSTEVTPSATGNGVSLIAAFN